MKLKRIHIEDFRSLERLELNVNTDALALFGLNGAGKSSVLYALQVLFHGKCPVTMGSRTTLDTLIRDGAKQAQISATLDNWQVSLTLKRRGANEFTVTDADTGEMPPDMQSREAFWAAAGVKPAHAAVAMLPDQYLCSRDLGGILADLLAGDISTEAVLALAGEHRDWLERYLQLSQATLESAADLTQLGKRVEGDRRERNKDLKYARDRVQQLVVVTPVLDVKGRARTTDDIPTIANQLEDVERKRTALFEERGRATAAAPVSADELAAAQAAVQAAVDAHDAAQAALEAARAAREQARTEESSANADSVRLERDIREAQAAVDALTSADGCCPTCGRKCTDTLRAKLIDPLQKRVTEAQAAYDAARARTDELRAALPAHHTAYADASTAVLVAQNAYQAALRKATELEGRQGGGRPVEEIEADIAEIEAKRERGRELLEKLQKVKEREDLLLEAKRTEGELAHYDWAVEAFRDGAIAKGLMSAGLDEFCARANLELNPLGYAMRVQVEGKTAEVWLCCPNQPERPVAHCSDGQKKLAEFAIAVAFADTGAPVLIDNLNELDAGLRKGVLRRLRDVEQVSTVLVAGAWQQSKTDWQAVAQALAPVTVCWVEDGNAKEMAA